MSVSVVTFLRRWFIEIKLIEKPNQNLSGGVVAASVLSNSLDTAGYERKKIKMYNL